MTLTERIACSIRCYSRQQVNLRFSGLHIVMEDCLTVSNADFHQDSKHGQWYHDNSNCYHGTIFRVCYLAENKHYR